MHKKSEIQALVLRCQQYDRAAQRQLYMMFADELMSIALRYAKDTSMARDLVHDTFLKVFEKIGSFKLNQGSFGGWMNRILINQAIEIYRRQKRMVYNTEDYFYETHANEIDVIQQLEAEDIIELLQILPEGGRLIFNMYVIEGFKHNEIGQILGISPSTSRSQLTRAKVLLRQAIAKEGRKLQEIRTRYPLDKPA